MKGLCYDEMQEPDCKYCGEKILANRGHFHGRMPTFCRYGGCIHKWHELRKKIQELKKSSDPNMLRIADMIERDVFTNKEPAIFWKKKLAEIMSKSRERKRRNEKPTPVISPKKWTMFWNNKFLNKASF